MADGVEHHPPGGGPGLDVGLAGTDPESGGDGRLEVLGRQVQVHLGPLRSVRPLRRSELLGAHQSEHRAGAGQADHAAVGSCEGLLEPEQGAVEGGQVVGAGQSREMEASGAMACGAVAFGMEPR